MIHRHNNRPRILASNLPLHHLSLYPGESPQYVCRDCRRWTVLNRGVALIHWDASGTARCPGSGQRVTRDISPEDWVARFEPAAEHAYLVAKSELRKPTGALVRPELGPPTQPSVHQIAAAR